MSVSSTWVFLNFQGWPAVLTVAAMLAYLASALMRIAKEGVLSGLFGLGWLLHGLVLLGDVLGWARPDAAVRFGFGPALSGTVWLIVLLLSIESHWVPLALVRRLWAAWGVLALLVLAWVPGDMLWDIQLRWVALHLALGMAAYGVLGAALMHAVLLHMAERGMRQKLPQPSVAGLPIMRLERLMFRLVLVGFGLLSTVLWLGWVTANQYVQAWHWDHKTLFALLAWLNFAILLVGHYAWGWRGVRAAYWVYAGAALLCLSYMGSRFVLEVLLQRTVG